MSSPDQCEENLCPASKNYTQPVNSDEDNQRLSVSRCGHHFPSRSQPRRTASLMSSHKSSLADNGYDKTDYIPENMKFGLFDILGIIFSICSFLIDTGTDIAVSIIHYRNKDFGYFGLTLAFIIIPTLVMTGISLRWYILDSRQEDAPPVSTKEWTLRIVFLLFQLGPILRYIDSLIYGMKFLRHKSKEEQKKYYHFMVYEDTDATLLRLFECFMEAAPQLVLQIYILAHTDMPNPKDKLILTQIAACIASLVSLSWSLVSYQRSLRLSLPDKNPLSWKAIAVQFLWRLFVIAARVLALALFASSYDWYIGIACGIHFVIMFLWIVTMKTSFTGISTNKCEELGYNTVLAVMFIFCYFNPVDNPTRNRYSIYYCFMFVENTLLMMLWYAKADSNLWYLYPAIVGHYLSFFVGLVFMVVYYLLLHPSGGIKIFFNRKIDDEVEKDALKSRKDGKYELKSVSPNNRVLHPRPAPPILPKKKKKGNINSTSFTPINRESNHTGTDV